MKFSEVAHLYLGCKMHDTQFNLTWELTPSHFPSNWKSADFLGGNSKPLLRPLSDMTREEDIEFEKTQRVLCVSTIVYSSKQLTPESFLWLLSKNFDLFGLIESGEALDATKEDITI